MINKYFLKKSFFSLLLILFASFLFVMANPNGLNKNGFSFLAFIYFVPILLVVHFEDYRKSMIFGFLYGFLSYFFYIDWLICYGIFLKLFACAVYGFFWALVFILLKYSDTHFKDLNFFVQFLILISFEFLKTKGFIGFGFGVSGYTQWNNLYLIQIADIFGVFGISALLIFCSVLIYKIILKIINKEKKFGIVLVSGCLWLFFLLFALIYGKVKINSFSHKQIEKKVSAILVQNNEDPWGSGFDYFRASVQKLIYLTNDALKEYPNADFVVWPETAVVPSINNFYSKEKTNRKLMIEALMHYFESKDCDFIIGNGYTVLENDVEKKYNSALYFKQNQNILPPKPEVHSKNHLVPFSENLPFGIKSETLENNFDLHLWDKSNEITIFSNKDYTFGTLICFEDNFDDISRKIKNQNADFLVNLSNDSWAKSEVCQKQHLAMAVFRCVENKIPTLRSACSGQTCFINNWGKIIGECEAFTETYGFYEIPLYEKCATIYSKCGNFFAIGLLIICFILLLNSLIFDILKKVGK